MQVNGSTEYNVVFGSMVMWIYDFLVRQCQGRYSVYMFHLTVSRPSRREITLYPNLGRSLVDTIKCLHLAEGVIIKGIDSK